MTDTTRAAILGVVEGMTEKIVLAFFIIGTRGLCHGGEGF
jgi:hypothetical protein